MAKRNHTQRRPAAANDDCFTPAEQAVRGNISHQAATLANPAAPAVSLAPPEPPEPRPPRKAPELKAERQITVTLYPQALPHTPWIRLRGRWLNEAGFPSRTRVRVQVAQGCLILTPFAAQAS